MSTQKWKNAASLIIAAKSMNSAVLSRTSSVSEVEKCQVYAILGLKRNHESGQFPNTYVFPGGIVDKSDFSVKWLDVFSRRGPTATADLDYLRLLTGEPRPSILCPSSHDVAVGHRQLRPELALRLTAIRETFEECGILLARPNSESSLGPLNSNVVRVTDTNRWQTRVQSNPFDLLDLFIELDCSPDVWSLYEWSNWLTPSSERRRYDTMFFLTTMNDEPTVNCNENEISKHRWCSPTEFLNLFGQRMIHLVPPQIYECLRLEEFGDLQSLRRFLSSDSKRRTNISTTFPCRMNAKDGILLLYPGDELYPKCPDIVSESSIPTSDSSIEELERSTKFLNRLSIDEDNNFRVVCNLRNGNKDLRWSSKL